MRKPFKMSKTTKPEPRIESKVLQRAPNNKMIVICRPKTKFDKSTFVLIHLVKASPNVNSFQTVLQNCIEV